LISAWAAWRAASIIIFVAGGVIGVEEQVAHGRRAGRLDPDHGREGFHLAEPA
jgi:hypothetical protein